MQNMRDREYDVTNISGGSVSWAQYYCRFCSADCGRVDSIGHNTVYHCQCEAARAHRAELKQKRARHEMAQLARGIHPSIAHTPTLATLARLALRHPDSAVREKARAAIARNGGH